MEETRTRDDNRWYESRCAFLRTIALRLDPLVRYVLRYESEYRRPPTLLDIPNNLLPLFNATADVQYNVIADSQRWMIYWYLLAPGAANVNYGVFRSSCYSGARDALVFLDDGMPLIMNDVAVTDVDAATGTSSAGVPISVARGNDLATLIQITNTLSSNDEVFSFLGKPDGLRRFPEGAWELQIADRAHDGMVLFWPHGDYACVYSGRGDIVAIHHGWAYVAGH